eukprot:NODE_59_length_28102_cov_0.971110.p2 type:complete len:705 gc:universal NODE_59_length_28102_cov_0.971110:16361-14247(-)
MKLGILLRHIPKNNMSIKLHMIGQAALLITPDSCYLFNPKEGIQRDLQQLQIPIKNVSHIFLSDKQNSSGIFGLLMTSSIFNAHTNIFSSDMSDYILGMTNFTEKIPNCTIYDFLRSDLEKEITREMKPVDFTYKGRNKDRDITGTGLEIKRESAFFQDNVVRVFPIFIRRKKPVKRTKIVKTNAGDSMTLCYSIHLPKYRGKVEMKKVEKFQIPPKDIGKIIKSGEEGVIFNGKKVTLSMISSEPRKGRIILLLFCPNIEYLHDLIDNPYVELYQKNNSDQELIVMHVTSSELFKTIAYSKFCNLFKNATHFQSDTTIMSGLPLYQEQISAMKSSCEFFHNSHGLGFGGFKEYEVYPSIKEVSSASASNQTSVPIYAEKNNENVSISIYGTGSAIPNLYRNVSGYSLNIENQRFLLDPGEDTLRSILFDLLDPNKSPEENSMRETQYWKSLSAIYVTHNHADHHSGIQTILTRWSLNTTIETIDVIVTPKLYNYLKALNDSSEYISSDRIFLHMSSWYTPKKYQRDSHLKSFMFNRVQDDQKAKFMRSSNVILETIPVNHPGQANACKITTKKFSFVYSGDTTYSQNLGEFSSNVDLLLHECTFENIDAENAAKKQHSTLNDALQIYEVAKPKKMILSHFSQKLPLFQADSIMKACKDSGYNIIPAFDSMTLPISDDAFKKYANDLPQIQEAIKKFHYSKKSN